MKKGAQTTDAEHTGVVVDANVWANALVYRIAVAQRRHPDRRHIDAERVLQAIRRDSRFVINVSDHVIAGVEQALVGEGRDPDQARAWAQQILARIRSRGGAHVANPPEVSDLSIEWEDRRVHDTAIATGSAFVVTGDEKFAQCRREAMAQPGQVMIFRPREFLDMLERQRPVGGGAPVEHALGATASEPEHTVSPPAAPHPQSRAVRLTPARQPHRILPRRPHRRTPPGGRER